MRHSRFRSTSTTLHISIRWKRSNRSSVSFSSHTFSLWHEHDMAKTLLRSCVKKHSQAKQSQVVSRASLHLLHTPSRPPQSSSPRCAPPPYCSPFSPADFISKRNDFS